MVADLHGELMRRGTIIGLATAHHTYRTSGVGCDHIRVMIGEALAQQQRMMAAVAADHPSASVAEIIEMAGRMSQHLQTGSMGSGKILHSELGRSQAAGRRDPVRPATRPTSALHTPLSYSCPASFGRAVTTLRDRVRWRPPRL